MSDFMKSIVEEVMKPNQKPKENPLFKGGSHSKSFTPLTKAVVKNKQTIPGINRPNYQRENMQKRLSLMSIESPNSIAEKPITKQTYHSPKGFAKGSLAMLQTMSLVQGTRSGNNHQAQTTSSNNQTNKASQFIGQTKDGVKAWLFSDFHPSLQDSFQRSLKTTSVGVISSVKCTAGQLFLLNEVLREFSSLKYYLTWDKENKKTFVLELYEHDPEVVSQAVNILFQKLSQNSYKSIQVFKSPSPSPWLIKQLNLKTHVNGIAVLEGIDYYSAVLLLDRHFKTSPNINFAYVLEKNYLLLHGNYKIVSQVSDELQNAAERLK
ncbi:hypothetical protein BGM26_06100 [Bacillus sp. FJAT-29790]|uniref:hypothetical protein n=1 Tax=Bacillus sp. FJAT-29790 TaxID=1895002 RepID=UPI001C23D5C7|nr:hypothetical protein [Bacillus sp. FJAT-29790]MBU8878560.1 hypothetical protein [Bacillus sp. FJAT-29790]